MIRQLSNRVCLEHRLSVIEHPKRGSLSYDKWLGDKAKPSQRDHLRQAIDAALEQSPPDLEALLALLAGAGIAVQCRGRSISLRTGTGKKFLRLDRLGEGYSWSDTLKPYTQGDIMKLRRGVKNGTEIHGRI